ncbi:alpha/beta hydrolase [Mesorhizobium sp. WSM4898]|uniref:alpha/beta hydrolase n=1 Tax=Mesorhizobium sp. WSM4898 TaxID=3038544 RepID=UPI0024156802|nr:alpha/beta hydrolase [Mesorhizobium sp. WSM4898]MDG4908087.1 alpha/beta hydrolase [Mesorhizobium sp. WSM4898]
MASFGLKVIRGVFGAAEHVAPRLSGRAAFELFCRTANVKALSDGERRAVERAAGFMAEARHHRLKTKADCVAVHEFRPGPGRGSRGTVLVIHGWRSRTEYMRTLIDGFRDAGYKVVSLDLPGHGHSLGRHLNMVTAVDAVRVAGEWFGPFAAAVGHSFGGAVAANAVAASVKGMPPLAAEKLVLIAAPSSLPAIFDDFSHRLNVGPRSRVAMADRVKHLSGRPLSDFTGDRQLAEAPVPTLIIHAPDDREVHADHAKRYAGAGDHVSLHWAEGLGHRRILADKDVAARAVGFVAEERQPALH